MRTYMYFQKSEVDKSEIMYHCADCDCNNNK